MSPRKKRFTFIGLALLCVLAAGVWLAWSPALLWFAKRDAAKKYADMQDAETLNVALAPDVRQINRMATVAGSGEPQRVAAVVDGYRFSFPAAKYQRLPGQYVDFDSGKLTVRCLGVLDLTGEFAKAATDDSALGGYFARTDPFHILVDAFNARPKDIERQASFEALNKHLALLLIKAVLMPVGADKHWERFDTGKCPGIIAGDTSMRGILVTLYLPGHRQFADILIRPKDGATMTDVYTAIAELEVSQDASSQTGERTEVRISLEPATAAQDLLESFARASSTGDYASAASRVVGNGDAMRLLKATCDFRHAWSAFYDQLTSSYGHEVADRFPRCGQMLFDTAIATLDGPKLLLFSEPSRVQDVGYQEGNQEQFVTVNDDKIASMVYLEGAWRMSLSSGADHNEILVAGFDAIASLYERFGSELEHSEIPIEELRANISNAVQKEARIRALHDAAVRSGFEKGMPMP